MLSSRKCNPQTSDFGSSFSRRTLLGAALASSLGAFGTLRASGQSSPIVLERGNAERTGVVPYKGPESLPTERWRVNLGGAVSKSVTVVGDRLFGGDVNGTLWALQVADGETLWRYDIGVGIWASAAFAEDAVYVGGSNGNLFAIDANTGEERWHLVTGDSITSSPLILGDTVAFGSWDGRIYSVNRATGDEQWQREIGHMVQASPAYHEGSIYVPSDSDGVFALDAASGEIRWHFDERSVLTAPTAAISNDLLYVTSSAEGDVIALQLSDGSLAWQAHLDRSTVPSPAVHGGLVFTSSEGFNDQTATYTNTVHALDAATGSEAWRFEPDDFVWSSPVIAGEYLYFSDLSGAIYAIRTSDGVVQWQLPGTGTDGAEIAISDGLLYVGVREGLLALG